MEIRVIPGSTMTTELREGIFDLCEQAYGQSLRDLFATFPDPVHIVAMIDGAAASHALWVTRWLAVGDGPPLRTAYVEAVATHPSYRNRGYASAIMRVLVREVSDFQLAALCAADRALSLYAALRWELWRGPLFIRSSSGLIETAGESVMVHRTPLTPPIDLTGRLSAEWRSGELW